MSLMRTKPHWCPSAIATNQGWVNPKSGELLVAIGGLARQLEAEQPVVPVSPVQTVSVVDTVVVAPVEEKIETHSIVKETKVKKPKKGQQIVAEVVEYDLDQDSIIGE
jgi:hypothetical protein